MFVGAGPKTVRRAGQADHIQRLRTKAMLLLTDLNKHNHSQNRITMTGNEVERRKQNRVKPVLSGNHLAVVMSLVMSLAIVAISSKNHVVNSLWFVVAAFALPMPIVLYLENRLGGFGIATRCAAIVLPLAAAILFGI